MDLPLPAAATKHRPKRKTKASTSTRAPKRSTSAVRSCASKKVILITLAVLLMFSGLYYFRGYVFTRDIMFVPDESLLTPQSTPSTPPAAVDLSATSSPSSRVIAHSPKPKVVAPPVSPPVAPPTLPPRSPPPKPSAAAVVPVVVNPKRFFKRPNENLFIDLAMVSQKCDAIQTGVQDCLNFLRDQESQYLVRRQEELPRCDSDHPIYFHAYWRGLMGKGLMWILKSFLFTQRLDCARYILWTEGFVPLDLAEIEKLAEKERFEDEENIRNGVPIAAPGRSKYPKIKMSTHYESVIELQKMRPYVEIRSFNLSDQLRLTNNMTSNQWRHHVDFMALSSAKNAAESATASQADKSEFAKLNATYSWDRQAKPREARFKWPLHMLRTKSELRGNAVSDSDTVRFILLFNHGGIYVDTDVLFLRDMRPWFFTSKAWSSSWALQDHYNTALLKADPGDATMALIMEKGIASGTKFHPYEIIGYLKGQRKGNSHLNLVAAESLLTLVPSGVFDSAWPWVEGNRQAYLPNVDLAFGLFDANSDREREFAVLKPNLGIETIKKAPLRQLRTLENLYAGAPAFHCHGIGFPMGKDSWVEITLEHYDCFVARTCRNIYNELYR